MASEEKDQHKPAAFRGVLGVLWSIVFVAVVVVGYYWLDDKHSQREDELQNEIDELRRKVEVLQHEKELESAEFRGRARGWAD